MPCTTDSTYRSDGCCTRLGCSAGRCHQCALTWEEMRQLDRGQLRDARRREIRICDCDPARIWHGDTCWEAEGSPCVGQDGEPLDKPDAMELAHRELEESLR